MLVCHCHRVCDRTIRLCVRVGARSAADVGASCGAGTACGGCKPTIEALLRTLTLGAPAADAEIAGDADAQPPLRRASGG